MIGVLLNPTEPTFDTQMDDVQEAARATRQQVRFMRASSKHEIDETFVTAAQLQLRAMLVGLS